jgi:hypothetical protein
MATIKVERYSGRNDCGNLRLIPNSVTDVDRGLRLFLQCEPHLSKTASVRGGGMYLKCCPEVYKPYPAYKGFLYKIESGICEGLTR